MGLSKERNLPLDESLAGTMDATKDNGDSTIGCPRDGVSATGALESAAEGVPAADTLSSTAEGELTMGARDAFTGGAGTGTPCRVRSRRRTAATADSVLRSVLLGKADMIDKADNLIKHERVNVYVSGLNTIIII